MNKQIHIKTDDETLEILENLKIKLNITKSDIIRMAIRHFNNYVQKVNN